MKLKTDVRHFGEIHMEDQTVDLQRVEDAPVSGGKLCERMQTATILWAICSAQSIHEQ